MADQKELEEQIGLLKAQLERLTYGLSALGNTVDVLPRSMQVNVEKKLSEGVIKIFGNAASRAEEEVVKNARKAGATEKEALESRLAVRKIHEQAAVRALQELGAAALKLGGELYKGMEGLSGFAQAADSGVSSVARFASLIGGPVTKAVSLLAVGLTKYATAAVAQSDKLYKAHKDMAVSGAAASDGIQGVYDMMQQFSLGSDELNKLTGIIAANSQSLAMFKGNVASGARALGEITGEIKDSGLREQFLSMGISMDEQRESAAAYISLQTRIGGVQTKSTKEIAASIGEYVKETDAITKITGATRKEQEAARNRAMAIEQFRFKQEQAAASGSEEEKKIAKTQLETFNMLSNLGPGGKQVAEGMAAMASGFITEGPGLALSNLIGTKGSEIMNDAALTAAQKTEAVMKEVDTALKGAGGTQAAFGQFGKVFQNLDYSALQDALKASGQFGKRLAEAKTEQERQIIINEAATAAQVKGEVANLDSRAAMQGFVQMGVLPATEAMAGFARGVAAATSILPQTAVGKPADARTTVQRTLTQRDDPRYTGPGPGINPMGAASGTLVAGAAPQTAAEKQAATRDAYNARFTGEINEQRRHREYDEKQAAAKTPAVTATGVAAGAIDSGPVFSSANRVQVTLTEIRDEIKKLVQMGAIPSGAASSQQSAQAALAEHDHAHPHDPAAAASPELAAQIGRIINPLEKMSVTSGMIRNDGKTAHGGIDLAGKIGDKVMAPISGLARVLTTEQSGGYGNMVEITDATTGVKHMLAHLDKSMVKTGDMIQAGAQIGTLGNTGNSSGAHLHHEMRDAQGTKLDPTQFYAGSAGRGQTTPGMPQAPIMAQSELKGQQREFYDKLYGTLLDQATQAGVKNPEALARVGAAQSSLETGYGKATAGGNNYFGIKGAGGNQQTTQEFDPKSGKMVTQKESFRKYGSMEESAADYIKLMQGSQRYAGVVGAGSTAEAIAAQGKSGYATDPDYAKKLAMITSSVTGQSFNMAGPAGMPTQVAAAPGTTAALPTAPAAGAETQSTQPSTVAQQNSLMLQQLVTLNQAQNGLLARILQTSQA